MSLRLSDDIERIFAYIFQKFPRVRKGEMKKGKNSPDSEKGWGKREKGNRFKSRKVTFDW